MAVPTVRTVNAKNQSYLAEAASSEAGWRRYLETLSRHTGCANAFYNLSAMNCAGLAASDWHECREILPISTWKSLFPGADIKAAEGCTGVYGVKSRPRGSGGGLFFVDELFPPALLVGLPPTRLRGAARVLDLSVDIAAASWSDAKAGLYRLVNVADMDNDAEAVPEAERVPVAWDDLDENTRFVIEAQRLVLGYDTPLTKPVDIKVERNKKIAIRGTNGLGKSTLLKTLLGLIKPVSGDIEHGEFVSVGYFEQEEAKGNMNTALEKLWQEYPGMTNFEVRAALASCGLTNEHITTKMTALSGGEAAKVRLAKIMQKPVNLLVLDEPTNHLDVEAKKELKRALQEYKGTLLLVSHEPDFYEDLVDTVWNIESWSTKIV